MNYSKLVNILSVLTPNETQRLREFMLSPFFNKNEKILRITDALCQKLVQNPPDTLPNKKTLFEENFPEESPSSQKINLLINEALRLTESFLFHLRTENTGYSDEEFVRMDFYAERGLPKYFQESMIKAEARNATLVYHNPRFYYEQFRLELYRRWYGLKSGSQPEDLQALETVNVSLNRFFVFSKLIIQCQLFSQELLVRKTIDDSWMSQHLLEMNIDEQLIHNELSLIYMKLLNLFVSPQDAQTRFFNVIEILKKMDTIAPPLRPKDMEIISECLESYCIHWVFEGDNQAEISLFKIYEKQIETKSIFPFDHQIPAQKFIRIFKTALNTNNTLWAKKFLNDYSDCLSASDQKQVIEFCRAELLFTEKKYKEAFLILGKIHLFNPVFATEYRVLAIKLLNELDYDLESELNKFRVFISRSHSLSERRKEYYRKFASYIHKLQSIKTDTPERAAENFLELSKTIVSNKAVAEFGYLRNQMDEISYSRNYSR